MHKIGQYKILKEIGEGSLAIVYKAQDPVLNRAVALKVLHPIFSKNKKSIERLRKEAQMLAQLDHPNIIRIHTFLDEKEAKGIVTEYVEGETLAQFLEKNPPILPEIACRIICDVLSALEHAHSRKIVHRDIKPENIIISKDGQVKLADFSIAKILDAESLTQTGQLIGSPLYLSPEQATGQKIDDRSDLFSVSILFYRMVTGRVPFYDRDSGVLLKKILESDAEKPSRLNAKVPVSMEKILTKGLQKNKEDRYQKAWEYRYVILNYLKDNNVSADDINLKEFFDNPTSYTNTFSVSVSKCLIQQGDLAFKKGQYHEASQIWNKVLEYDPNNKTVHEQIQKLTKFQRKAFYRKSTFVLFPLVLLLSLYGGYAVFTKQSETQLVSKKLEPSIKILETAKVQWSYLKINKDETTEFFINDRMVFVDENTPVRLKPGKYRIKFRRPGFRDIQANIVLKPGETSTINIRKGT